MNIKEDISQDVLREDLKEEGLETFLASLYTPVRFYCIVNDSVKDMHLALNPPEDFSRMNV